MSKVVSTFDVRCFRVIGLWQLISSTKGYSNWSKSNSDHQNNTSKNITDNSYRSKNSSDKIFGNNNFKNISDNIFKSNSPGYFYLLNVTVMTVFAPYVLMEFFGLMTSHYDFVTLTEKLSVNITLLESAVKFLYCYMRRRQLADLLRVFEENFLLCMQQNRDTNLKILENYAKNLTGSINLFIIIIYATVGLWNSLPILSCLQGTGCSTLQIMPSWYPISIDQAPIKQLVYLLEFIIMCYCASLLYSVNCLILAFARMISSQVEILKLSMTNLAENTARAVYGKLVKNGNFTGSEILERRYQKKLDDLQKDCLIDYQRILSQAALMEETFSPLIIFQLAVSTITLCLVLISLTTKTAANSTISLTLGCKFSMYLIFGLMELFVYSWCGHIIQDQTGSLHGSLYEMAWLSNSLNFKKNVLQAMTRALRPCRLTAGKFRPVDFKTFAGVLKMSYSLFTFLYGSGLKK